MYSRWKRNPESVTESWSAFFSGTDHLISKQPPGTRKFKNQPVDNTRTKARSPEATASAPAPDPPAPVADWKNGESENPEGVTKLVFCTGKVYYDLFKEREDHEQDDTVSIKRIEQQLELYAESELLWAQEEHKNSGAWSYVQPRLDTTLMQNENETRCLSYHGRPPSSSPATGNKVQHFKEYEAFMDSIFGELTEENKARLECIIKEQQAKAKTESQKPPDKTEALSKKPSNPEPTGKEGFTAGASPPPVSAERALLKPTSDESSRGL